MDNAVALVRAYLHVNGYFTVTEYPVLEAVKYGGYRTVTDLDVLAFRFSGAGRLLAGVEQQETGTLRFEPDSELGVPVDRSDMLIGEVKEGRARLNENMIHPAVLRTVLARFGCCAPEHVPEVVEHLLQHGKTTMPAGHQVRLVVFASQDESTGHPGCRVIPLGHVVRFLQDHLETYWDVLHHAQFKDPAFGFLMTLEKALRQGALPKQDITR